MNINDIVVPECLPDSETVRTDICDYFWEIQRFDREVGDLVKILEKEKKLDETILVITGDNGMPFPRCKSNLYDLGTNVPLAIRWSNRIKGGRIVKDFISLQDLAPTILEAAGLKPPPEMTAHSFMDILATSKSGQIDPTRNRIFTGMERHAWVRKNGQGYPMRAIRTDEFLYILNFKPDRWPAGDPDGDEKNSPPGPYGDIDHSPSKSYMLEHQNSPEVKKIFELAFGKRPSEELYDLRQDPGQMNNIANNTEYAGVKAKLKDELITLLKTTKDPRVLGKGDVFDSYPYHGGGGKIPDIKK